MDLHTLGIDVISLLLTCLDGAYSSLGHQPKSCTVSEKRLAFQQLHTKKMSLPVLLTGVTTLAALFLRPSARIPYDIPTAATPSAAQWQFSNQELSGNSLSQQFSKCGLVASASSRTVRSKNFWASETMPGAQ